MSRRYLVLDSDPADDALRWELDRALRTGALSDLCFEYRFREADHETLLRDMWEAQDTQAILTLVSDRATPAHYLIVAAGSDELVDRIAGELERVVPIVPLETLQEQAGRIDETHDAASLVRLALGSDAYEPDPRSVALISDGFSHEQPLVRYRSAEAAALAPHRAFIPALDRLAAEDPDASVREMAHRAARAHLPSGDAADPGPPQVG